MEFITVNNRRISFIIIANMYLLCITSFYSLDLENLLPHESHILPLYGALSIIIIAPKQKYFPMAMCPPTHLKHMQVDKENQN